jgi:hypothetical protein
MQSIDITMRNTVLSTFLLVFSSLSLQAQKPLHTTEDYGKAFSILHTLGGEMEMSLSTAEQSWKGLKKLENGLDFRTECTYPVNENGLKELTFYFDKDKTEPLYEMILEFEHADTLAAFCAKDLGASNHPGLGDHWIMSITEEGQAFIVWRYENKLVFATNLSDTELADDPAFQFDQDFIYTFNHPLEEPEGDSPTQDERSADSLPADHEFTVLLNLFIGNALSNFEALKGEPMEGKKGRFNLVIDNELQANALISNNGSKTWRLEAELFMNEPLEDARNNYNAIVTVIQKLEALEYQLVKKSEDSNKKGQSYIWDVSSLEGKRLGVTLKVQLYASGEDLYSVRMEVAN